MASTRELKSRIRSVGSTKQITKAMQLVAASKMRRAQDADKASEPYTDAASELLTYLANQGATEDHPLFARRQVKSRLLIVLSADKGLAGAYNSNVLKLYTEALRSDEQEGSTNQTIALGRRAAQFVARIRGTQMIAAYEDIADRPDIRMLNTVLGTAIEKFESGEVDAVDVIFTEFVSSMTQAATMRRLLPAGYAVTGTDADFHDARYEPSAELVLDRVVNRLLTAQLFQAVLDAKASEHSMRMVAMKNATDNANDLIDDLTLEMNKVRQGAITQELAEISGGVEAMNE